MRRFAVVVVISLVGLAGCASAENGDVSDTPPPNTELIATGADLYASSCAAGYSAEVLQVLEVLAELGRARDARLRPALLWLLSLQDEQGRWLNRYAYNRKTTVGIEKQGEPSRWVTLRACAVLAAAG